MNGESDLKTLLASMSPKLVDGEFVFCTFPDAGYGDHSELDPVAAIKESEGLALVLPRSKADDRSLPYESVFRQITLMIHSSLDAVGLTAAVASRLADHGISANVVAGYYHDHIFVPVEAAEQALGALKEQV